MLALILAIIGCITGFASLAIHFYKVLLERVKLKFEFIHDTPVYYFKSPRANPADQPGQHHAVISFVISNSSAHPISITRVMVKSLHNKVQLPHVPTAEFKPAYATLDNGNQMFYEFPDPMPLPLALSGFGAERVSIMLPDFQSMLIDEKRPVKVNIRFYTSRTCRSHSVWICEIQDFHARRLQN